jgi:ribokinase
VTLGERGVLLVGADGIVRQLAAPAVDATDTAGAGDAFVGAFAAGLARRLPEIDAARLGIACASDSVARPGTQASFPGPDRCAELLVGIRG